MENQRRTDDDDALRGCTITYAFAASDLSSCERIINITGNLEYLVTSRDGIEHLTSSFETSVNGFEYFYDTRI